MIRTYIRWTICWTENTKQRSDPQMTVVHYNGNSICWYFPIWWVDLLFSTFMIHLSITIIAPLKHEDWSIEKIAFKYTSDTLDYTHKKEHQDTIEKLSTSCRTHFYPQMLHIFYIFKDAFRFPWLNKFTYHISHNYKWSNFFYST